MKKLLILKLMKCVCLANITNLDQWALILIIELDKWKLFLISTNP